MSFRLHSIIHDEIELLVDSIAAVVHEEVSRGYDKDSVKKALRPFVKKAYASGYYDGKGDSLESLIVSKLSRR